MELESIRQEYIEATFKRNTAMIDELKRILSENGFTKDVIRLSDNVRGRIKIIDPSYDDPPSLGFYTYTKYNKLATYASGYVGTAWTTADTIKALLNNYRIVEDGV